MRLAKVWGLNPGWFPCGNRIVTSIPGCLIVSRLARKYQALLLLNGANQKGEDLGYSRGIKETMAVENQELHPLLSELTSGDDARARAAVDQLARVPGEKLFPGLKELLSSPDPDLRWWAVRALAELDAPERSGLLRKMVGDEDPLVQQCAVLALREKPAPEAGPELAGLLSSLDSLTARLAGDALISLGPGAVPILMEILTGKGEKGQAEAVRALAIIEDQRAIPLLYGLLDSESALVTYWAEEGLSRLGVGMVFFDPGAG